MILGDEFVEKERCHSPSTAQIDTEVQVLFDWCIVKMEFTVRYTRQITALFTDISIKIH